MLNRHKLIFIILVLLSSSSYSQNIKSINISDNKIFSEKEYLAWSGLAVSAKIKPEYLDSALLRIASNLTSRGYFYADFSGSNIEYNSDSSSAVVNLFIDEGPAAYFRKINIDYPDSSDKAEIVESFNYLEGRVFDKAEFEEVVANLLHYFENNGYPFANIKIGSVSFVKDTLEEEYFADVFVNINKDLKGMIDRFEIKGNDKTNDDVIIRELRIKPGEIYSQKEIDELPNKLNRLRFFEPVNPPQFYFSSDNKGILLIEVKEKQTNNFDGIIGYIPANKPDDKGFVTGLVNVSLRNIFGSGRSAAIRWQKLDRNSQDLELKYLEPWFLGYPFNIGVGFNQRKQDTIYVQRKFEGAIEFLATETITASLQFAAESIIPSENLANIFTVYNSSSILTGLNFKIDTRDDPYAPTEGILFNNTYSYSRKKINGPQQFISTDLKTNINLQRILLGLDFYYSIFSRQVVALKLNGRELQGSFFEISDLFRLGGTNSLRGYREDQFLGSRVFWSNLEYRLLLARRTYTYLFFDTGYYLVKEDAARKVSKQEEFNIGYGLGLNIETSLGVIGVSFALAKGDSFSDGKIHFGLVSEF
ncbi:MAG TPA: BamA/TamA family outer membrane protein [Ignavibacteriaceae bacterium]